MKTDLCFVLLVVVVVTAPAVGVAEQPSELEDDEIADEADPEAVERAQEYFDKGAQAYFAGDYSAAALEFRRAHEHYPHPLFMYNFARASQQLGQIENAVEASMRARSMDEALPPEQDARNSGLIYGGTVGLQGHDLVEELGAAPVAEEVEAPPEVDDSDWDLLGWTGVGALGAGIGGIVAGAVAHHDVQPHRQELDTRLERSPENSAGVEQLQSEVESREMQRNLLFGSGVGLAVVGTGLIIWESQTGSSDTDTDATAVNITVGPTGAGMTYQW